MFKGTSPDIIVRRLMRKEQEGRVVRFTVQTNVVFVSKTLLLTSFLFFCKVLGGKGSSTIVSSTSKNTDRYFRPSDRSRLGGLLQYSSKGTLHTLETTIVLPLSLVFLFYCQWTVTPRVGWSIWRKLLKFLNRRTCQKKLSPHRDTRNIQQLLDLFVGFQSSHCRETLKSLVLPQLNMSPRVSSTGLGDLRIILLSKLPKFVSSFFIFLYVTVKYLFTVCSPFRHKSL